MFTRRNEDWKFNMNQSINNVRVDIRKILKMSDPRSSPEMRGNKNSMKAE